MTVQTPETPSVRVASPQVPERTETTSDDPAMVRLVAEDFHLYYGAHHALKEIGRAHV